MKTLIKREEDKPKQVILNVTPKEGLAEERKKIREIKLLADTTITLTSGWDVPACQEAIAEMQNGQFMRAGLLWDTVLTDDAVRSAVSTRRLALLGSKKTIIPADHPNKKLAQKVAEKIEEKYETFLSGALAPIFQNALGMGFAIAHMYWNPDSYDGHCVYPTITNWHPANVWYHLAERRYYANTLEGPCTVIPGDGEWILHAPTREYMGWLDGYLRNLWLPFMVRSYAWRDWARYNERHGMPFIKLKIPAMADVDEKNSFVDGMSNLSNETMIPLPQSGDPQGSWDMELVEATSNSWQTFEGTLKSTSERIAILVLGQNLTSNVDGGSFAAAQIHDKIRHVYLSDDGKALSRTLNQILVPFAEYNFGDPKLAPTIVFDTAPPEDKKMKMDTFSAAIQVVSSAQGLPINVEQILKEVGIPTIDPSKNPQGQGMDLQKMLQSMQGGQGQGAPPNGQNQPQEQPKAEDLATLTEGNEDALIDGIDEDDSSTVYEEPINVESINAVNRPNEMKAYNFITELMKHSSQEGKAAISPLVESVTEVIRSARSYGEMKEKLLEIAQSHDISELESQMKKSFLLASLTGGAAPFKQETSV
jgi:phage gp29-like protein